MTDPERLGIAGELLAVADALRASRNHALRLLREEPSVRLSPDVLRVIIQGRLVAESLDVLAAHVRGLVSE